MATRVRPRSCSSLWAGTMNESTSPPSRCGYAHAAPTPASASTSDVMNTSVGRVIGDLLPLLSAVMGEEPRLVIGHHEPFSQPTGRHDAVAFRFESAFDVGDAARVLRVQFAAGLEGP